MNYFEKIYCINLDNDTEKLSYFNNELLKTNIKNYERFAAIDGSKLDLSLIDSTIITNHSRSNIKSKHQKVFGISLTFGSLGCALSHKKIFEECQHSSKPFLIFEDDIIVEKNFTNIFEQIIQRSPEYDILYLGYNEIGGFRKKKIDDLLSVPSGLITGLYGYMLSPTGAKKLLSTIFPLNKQIDSSICDNSSRLNLLCSTERILGVTHQFGSKTQRNKSCENIYAVDDWDKLFKKV